MINVGGEHCTGLCEGDNVLIVLKVVLVVVVVRIVVVCALAD